LPGHGSKLATIHSLALNQKLVAGWPADVNTRKGLDLRLEEKI